MVDGYTYDVFGALKSQSGSSDNYWLFTGEQLDPEAATAGGSQRLPLDEVVSSSNVTDATVENLRDDPDAPDSDIRALILAWLRLKRQPVDSLLPKHLRLSAVPHVASP